MHCVRRYTRTAVKSLASVLAAMGLGRSSAMICGPISIDKTTVARDSTAMECSRLQIVARRWLCWTPLADPAICSMLLMVAMPVTALNLKLLCFLRSEEHAKLWRLTCMLLLAGAKWLHSMM